MVQMVILKKMNPKLKNYNDDKNVDPVADEVVTIEETEEN